MRKLTFILVGAGIAMGVFNWAVNTTIGCVTVCSLGGLIVLSGLIIMLKEEVENREIFNRVCEECKDKIVRGKNDSHIDHVNKQFSYYNFVYNNLMETEDKKVLLDKVRGNKNICDSFKK